MCYFIQENNFKHFINGFFNKMLTNVFYKNTI